MRTIWRGSLSFGLINIPVRLYSASQERELHFKLLHKKDLSEVRYARICKTEGKEIPWEEIVKGYENENGKYIILSEEDFKRADLKKEQTIEILHFTETEEIDSIYYDTPYYLEPEKSAVKAYHLLREALQKSGKVSVATFVLKHHEHVCVIKPHENMLILQQLRYKNQMLNPKDLNLAKASNTKKELDTAIKFIDQLTMAFKPESYADTYVKEVKKIIKAKGKGKTIVQKKEKTPKSSKVHDIMSLLEESLQKHKKKPKLKRSA